MKTILTVLDARKYKVFGGAELATYLITKTLAKHFNVTVLTGTTTPALVRGANIIIMPQLKASSKAELWLNILRDRDFFRRVIAKNDIVYIPKYALPLIAIAKKLKKKVILHLHDYIPVSFTATIFAPYEKYRDSIRRYDIWLMYKQGIKRCIGSAYLLWLTRQARKWAIMADKIVCVSKRQMQIISDLVPELKRKIITIYNPLPPVPRIERKLSQKPLLLFLGGDSIIKGFHLVLYAITKLADIRELQIIIAGNISKVSLTIIKRLNRKIGRTIVMPLGRVPYSKVINLLSRAWTTLHPSICEETFSYTIIESIISGTLPIASKVGAIPEIIKGNVSNKILFDVNNVNDFIERIITIMNMTREQLINAGIVLREDVIKRLSHSKRKISSLMYD